MRRRRKQPDITAEEAQLAEARASGEISTRSARVVGYIRPELSELVHKGMDDGRFASESDAVNWALATLLGREDLA